VLIADRCYAGYFMIAWLMHWGVDVVIRQHQSRKTDFRRGQRLGPRDHVVSWIRPARPSWMDEASYAAMPETLRLREVRAGGWTLVSTLTDGAPGQQAGAVRPLPPALGRWSWICASIKAVMQMDVLRCKESADGLQRDRRTSVALTTWCVR